MILFLFNYCYEKKEKKNITKIKIRLTKKNDKMPVTNFHD